MLCRKDQNKKKADIGVNSVMKYYENQGYSCQDVSTDRKYIGYDIVANKEDKSLKIEVKCSKTPGGIPDSYPSEVDKNLGLVADYLCIVRLNGKEKPRAIDILSKVEVDKYYDKHRKVERIRWASRLKTDLKNQKAGKRVPIDDLF